MQSTKASIDEVCKRYGENEGQLLKDIKELEQWLKGQKHLPQDAADQYLLEKFVLSGKGDLSKSMIKLDTYFTVRNFVTELFTQRDPLAPDLIENSECMYMGLLPGLTPDGARVLMTSLTTADASKFELRPTIQRIFNILDVWLRTDPHVNKLYVVSDCEKSTLPLMMKISLSTMKNTVFCIQNVYPVSLCGVIFLNIVPVVGVVIEKIIKPLFSKKLSKRFLFCGNDSSALYEKVPRSMMPKDLGGDGPTMKEINQAWMDKVNENRDWLISSASSHSDESLREGESPYKKAGCSVM